MNQQFQPLDSNVEAFLEELSDFELSEVKGGVSLNTTASGSVSISGYLTNGVATISSANTVITNGGSLTSSSSSATNTGSTGSSWYVSVSTYED